jgi:hypothetical protein
MPTGAGISTTGWSGRVQVDAVSRGEGLLLAAGALVGVLGVLKGIGPAFVPGSDFYWLLSYEHGFIRRAFLGTLFRPFLHIWAWDRLKPAVAATQIVVCFAIVWMFAAMFTRAVRREQRLDSRITLMAAFVLLMASQLMPTLAHDIGYVDVYLVLLVLVGFRLAQTGRYVVAALAWLTPSTTSARF